MFARLLPASIFDALLLVMAIWGASRSRARNWKRSSMARGSRIDWTGERERNARRIRLVFAFCLAAVIMVGFGALMYDVAANKGSRCVESRAA